MRKGEASMENHDVEKELELTNPDSIEDIQEKEIPAAAVMPQILSKVQAEIEKGYREVIHNDKTYRIYFPSVGEEEEMSLNYARGYSLLLKTDGILSESEMIREYDERGMWTKEDNEEIDSLRDDIESFKEEITEAMLKEEQGDAESGKAQAIAIYEKQAKAMHKLKDVQLKKAGLFNTCLENLSQEIMIRSKLSCCAKDENGKRIWDGLDELNEEKDTRLVLTLLKSAMYFWQGIPEDFLDGLPDNLFGE